MGFIELSILSLGLAMDAFAVSMCLGVGFQKVTVKKALAVGLYFGIFQAVMPLIGYLMASLFADGAEGYAHWIAFVLLAFLGVKMIIGAFKKSDDAEAKETSLKPKKMLPYAVATSIDAFAVGVTLAILKVSIFPAVVVIGVVTLCVCMAGVKLGNMLGRKFKTRAEIFGGIILILMGLKILLEHLGVIAL
jgi:putative Mn2+ efflux pump MntP